MNGGGGKGLKINNAKSSVAPAPQVLDAAFQKAADEAAERIAGYKERAWDLGVKLKSLMESTILPENKTPLNKDFESEVLQKLSALATDINADETQPESSGSVALAQLIMKMMLVQKDQISMLRYQVETLNKKLSTKE